MSTCLPPIPFYTLPFRILKYRLSKPIYPLLQQRQWRCHPLFFYPANKNENNKCTQSVGLSLIWSSGVPFINNTPISVAAIRTKILLLFRLQKH